MENGKMEVVRTEGVTKRFGDFVAVDHVDFLLRHNETVAIIGPNGAGKTTFLNLITGFYPPDHGTVFYQGEDINTLSPEKRVGIGILRTFQLVRVFDNLRVYDHVGLAYYRKMKGSSVPLQMFVSNLKHREIDDRVQESLEMFELAPFKDEVVGNLPLGSKRRLEIAMAFVTDPQVVVLDEPFSGLSDLEIDEIKRVFKKYSHNKTILIVEHKISKLIDFIDWLAVMNEGKVIASGPPELTLENSDVRRVYWKVT
jgi:branched-chain amino acid transport system ATP-binding protein